MAELFDIGHEADLSEYDSTVTDGGDLSQGSPGLAGTSGRMECLIDDTTSIYGVKNQVDTSNRIRFRFYLDPNSLSIPDNQNFLIMTLIQSDASRLFGCQLKWSPGASSYVLFFTANDDEDVAHTIDDYDLVSDTEMLIEVDLQRETGDGNDDGSIEAWIDGVSIGSLADVGNWTAWLDMTYFRVGAVGWIDAGTSGTFYLDEFKANDDGSEIGPVVTGYTIIANQGSYSLSGQAASPLADRKIAADQGSYSLSGQAAALLRGYLIAAAQGSYSLTGQAAGLLVDRLLGVAQGSYTLTGQTTGLLIARLLAATQGSYTLTGQAVTLTYTPIGGYTIVAESGSYALSGQAVSLLTERLLTADQGSYVLSGQATEILKGFYISAAQGSYTLTGQAASLLIDYVIALNQGSYTLTGFTSLLDYSGVVTVRGMKDNLHRLRYDRINALGRSPSKRYNRLRGRPWRG